MIETTMEDNVEIIRAQLQRYGGSQKTAGEYIMVQCPFHDDRSPSCGVFMRIDHPSKNLGWFNCLGCGAHGDWNTFAERAKLESVKAWNSKETKVSYDTRADDDALLGDIGLTLKAVFREMRCPEAIRWPTYMNWRGVEGELIAAVGGCAINDERNNDVALLFPIKIGNKIRGAVKAINKKSHEQLGYITMPGNWVKRFGLFPYSYTAKMIRDKGHDFVILVEGPRDALRLLKMGLPAIAILGANTISETKLMFVASLGVKQVYVMPDNDKGGDMLWHNVKRKMEDARRLKLPTEVKANGDLIKMDPFSMPASVAKRVRELMRERHNWRK